MLFLVIFLIFVQTISSYKSTSIRFRAVNNIKHNKLRPLHAAAVTTVIENDNNCLDITRYYECVDSYCRGRSPNPIAPTSIELQAKAISDISDINKNLIPNKNIKTSGGYTTSAVRDGIYLYLLDSLQDRLNLENATVY